VSHLARVRNRGRRHEQSRRARRGGRHLAEKAKAVFVSKDGAVDKGPGTSPSTISARFRFEYNDGRTGGRGVFVVPAGASLGSPTPGWLVNKASVAKYVNKAAPDGPTGVKVAAIKPQKLAKLVAKSLGDLPVDIFGAGDPGAAGITAVYTVRNDDVTTRMCTLFDVVSGSSTTYKLIAGGTGAKLVLKRGVPTTCPPALEVLSLFVANNDSFGSQDHQICAGNGLGGFTCTDAVAATDTRRVAGADVDDDGHVDLILANDNPNQFCRGDGAGGFTCSTITTHALTTGVAVGHFDADTNLDAVFVNHSFGFENRFCAGNGSGAFSCSDVSPDVDPSFGVAAGHVNTDTNLDVVIANWNARNRVCLGNGTGAFVCNDVSTDTNSTSGVALGHVDGDTFLDAVFANRGQPNRLCRGLGDGTFGCSDVSGDTNDSYQVALGHMNEDGNVDAVFGNILQANRVCRGDGLGGFTCSNVSTDANTTEGVTLADVDGDGDLDVVFANGGQRNRVCTNDGDGIGFTCRDLSTDSRDSRDIAAAEFVE
jgi:hypothetical protein